MSHSIVLPQLWGSSDGGDFDIFDALAAMEGCLTIPQLATMLGVSKNGLYEMAKIGTLPSLHIGTSIRLNPRAVIKWLRDRTRATSKQFH
jgi:excisionase family DNA binding protein